MEVKVSTPAWVGISSLRPEKRHGVEAWLERLKNWESDPLVRSQAVRFPGEEPLFLLKTDTDFRLIFELKNNAITVLDLVSRATLEMFKQASASSQG